MFTLSTSAPANEFQRDGQAEKGPYREGTIPVGQFIANGFGLTDMHGQVWEWQAGSFKSTSVDADSSDDHSKDASGPRCVCGGSWADGATYCRASGRFRDDAGIRISGTGFRLSRTP